MIQALKCVLHIMRTFNPYSSLKRYMLFIIPILQNSEASSVRFVAQGCRVLLDTVPMNLITDLSVILKP